MTSKTTAPILPYRKILPEGFHCPEPEYWHEDMLQDLVLADVNAPIRDHFSHRPEVLVDGGGYVFYDPNDLTRRRLRPDLYVVFGVDTESVLERGGYVIHEAGKPPDFALEIASPSTFRRDTREKRVLYADIGVGEYWRFDSTGGSLYGYQLAGDILVEGVYEAAELTQEEDGMLWGYSPALDLCLCAKDRRLKFFDRKTGRYLPTIAEQRAALSEEQTAHRQTAAERDAAQAEVDRLREELRRLQGR